MERINERAVLFLPWSTIEAEAQQQIHRSELQRINSHLEQLVNVKGD